MTNDEKKTISLEDIGKKDIKCEDRKDCEGCTGCDDANNENGDEEEELKNAKSDGNLWLIRDLAKELYRVLGEQETDEDRAFTKFFKTKMVKIDSLICHFFSFQRSQAIFALNHFIVNNSKIIKITNFDEGELSPQYEKVKISRNKTEVLMTVGYYFIIYKKTKFIIELFFRGNTMINKIWFNKREKNKAHELDKAFTKFMRKNNLMKGEKLVLLARGNIDFLEYPNLCWNDVILSKLIKEEFDLNILFPLMNEKKVKSKGIPWRRGLMLGGKAGTGKTQVCRILCNELPKGVTLIWATSKSLYDTELIQHLFDAARYFSPTLIIIEDIDFIGTSRNFTQNPILGELLTQLDGNDPNDGIFIIATTNRPELLDEALANRPSRFDIQVKFELPAIKERVNLIKLFTKNMKFSEPLLYMEIARRIEGLTGAHIKEIFVYCQLKALKRDGIISTKDINDRVTYYEKLIRVKQMVI